MALEPFLGYIYFLVAVVFWIAFLWVLKRLNLVEPLESPPEGETPRKRFGLSIMAFFLMWKTGKGRALIDRLARRRRFWRVFGNVSIVLVGIAMVAMTALLAFLAFLVVNVPPGREPRPELLIGIPGLNPLIPIWYGIFALAISIIVHEFCHGILARVSNIRVNSLGLLFFIVPVGAFVEPDEGEMKRLPRVERARLFASGPAVNILLAVFFAFFFSTVMMSNVTPVAEGVGISAVTPLGPAENATIRPGYILLAVNNTDTPNLSAFLGAMANTRSGQVVTVNFTAKSLPDTQSISITLADAAVFTGDPSRAGRGFLGVTAFPLRLTSAYFHPIGGAGELGGPLQSVVAYISLPFTGLQPMQGVATEFYEVGGGWASLGDGFWILANVVYWLFWLNLMLGMTNALPAVPLDGGYVFRDALHALMARIRSGMTIEARERVVKNVSYAFALAIFVLILWQLVGPWIF